MRDNFKNPDTGATFHIAFVRSAYSKDKKCMMYFDSNGDPLMDSGTLLVPNVVAGDVGTTAIRTPTKNR